ncbi:MAG: beta-N-acetylglucosaminidase domain-containing protein [Caulobacteraceae bacterium]|nr:beta-N-acetylglucosaminidase domain-containing protein [Caulobacteraceae bacterium]
MDVELGLIEGYYGKPWDWAMRAEQVRALAPHGYGFYLYAPKADPFLRRRWQEDHPPETARALGDLAAACRAQGVRFGVGLSPFELYRDFSGPAQAALARKLAFLDEIGVQDLGVLFDDMRGDLPDLAETQVSIIHWIAERTRAGRVIACPTYYTDDPVLDRVFGQRPDGYLEAFGAGLDPAIEVFWTGEEVCSREFSPGHLARVAGQLSRKPFLWDNYPVNDGPRMSPHLHLRAFTGRPAAIGPHIAAHGVNPALQPVLSRIPAITLADSYRLGEAYEYGRAFERAAAETLGPELGALVQRHLTLLQDTGLDRLGEATARLRARYAAFDHPGAREITAFLDGAWTVTSMEEEA